ncbi:SIMPL domain-containing protein [Massilia sp. TS11]|uniref:SIMPL domain-containing protein n=1 Tax=Massilia sp. TS11 TaxID=2908003 RepID=UPI001EDB97F7|nr:SIMPL domain-containing protein [Massilia sp. TS11]MCG2583213.1 SIMPL domain-containing protein [Massilia sp. TS11]
MLTRILLLASLALAPLAQAQSLPSTRGSLVVIAANGEVTRANDQAVAEFYVEEQDKDKAAAASRVNSKMKEGMALLRKADPTAELKSHGYYTYAVYDERQPNVQAAPPKRSLIGWRVGQYLSLKTSNLAELPRTVAAGQQLLGLNGLQFGLAPATARQLDAERIAAAYADFQARLAAVARAMGRQPGEAVVELIDYEGSGRYGGEAPEAMRSVSIMGSAVRAKGGAPEVAEPSFEPGETTLPLRMVAKVRFQ